MRNESCQEGFGVQNILILVIVFSAFLIYQYSVGARDYLEHVVSRLWSHNKLLYKWYNLCISRNKMHISIHHGGPALLVLYNKLFHSTLFYSTLFHFSGSILFLLCSAIHDNEYVLSSFFILFLRDYSVYIISYIVLYDGWVIVKCNRVFKL